jgi:hypothetical protein
VGHDGSTSQRKHSQNVVNCFYPKWRQVMPRSVTDVDLLSAYVRGVMGRADHHAKNVEDISLALAGAIIWRKDPVPLEVMEQDGDLKNVLWVHISGLRYALSYNHRASTIEIRQGTTRGAVLGSFSNSTPLQDVKSFFAAL